MTLDDIARILARLERTDVTECLLEQGVETLRVKFDRTTKSASDVGRSGTTATAAEAAVTPETLALKTTGTGIFRRAHPLAVEEHSAGSLVRCGQHVAYVEVDSVFSAIVAPEDGVPQASLVADGALVGYGQTVCELRIDRLKPPGDGNA